MQFSLLSRFEHAGPGPVDSDIADWMALSSDLEQIGALVGGVGSPSGLRPVEGVGRSETVVALTGRSVIG